MSAPVQNPWAQPADNFADLDSFAGEYKAQSAFRPGLDTLANGDYDCEVIAAALDHVNADRVLRLGLRVGPGKVVEQVHWLNRQESVNRLGADLCCLGFDADKWGPATNRPLSVELPKAVAKLKGLKFRATKTSRNGTGQYVGKVYHDLHIACRLDGRPMPALTSPSVAPSAATAPTQHTSVDASDIPF